MQKPTSNEDLVKIIEEMMKCHNCKKPTTRFILFRTELGLVEEYECLECRQERVQRQVDAGLRPASDLEQENLPEVKNPAIGRRKENDD